MRFAKGHGTGNDFVVLPDESATLAWSAADVARICDRRFGLGGDGILRVVRTRDVPEAAVQAADAEWFMDYRNADGSIVETCGNGIRVFARYLADQGLVEGSGFAVATRAGLVAVTLHDDGDVTVDMGAPRTTATHDDGSVEVSMGNPHVVCFVDDLMAAPVTADGRARDDAAANGTNVEYVQVASPTALSMRVWERGVGETLSCGSGACAAVVGAHVAGHAGRDVAVTVPGGRLQVHWQDSGGVLLRGPAVIVAHGELRPGRPVADEGMA